MYVIYKLCLKNAVFMLKKKALCLKTEPKGAPFALPFFQEIGSFSACLHFPTDSCLMSHLITCKRLE
jgi:hypothetical protein